MDSSGNMYANKAALEAMEETLREHFKPTEAMPADALAIDDQEVAGALARLNHRARRVYFSERRRGRDEHASLVAARESYGR